MDIGNKIKEYRKMLNMSQDELALKVFVSRQTVSNWETNKSYPDIKSLSLLSNIFNVSLDDFIKGDIDEMKRIVDEEKVKEFHLLSIIYSIELIILIISPSPLAKFLNTIGIVIWVLCLIVTFGTAFFIERFKRNYDIQTYKEIIAFCEGKQLTHDETQQEFGKRIYQKILYAIIVGMIAFVVSVVIIFIVDRL